MGPDKTASVFDEHLMPILSYFGHWTMSFSTLVINLIPCDKFSISRGSNVVCYILPYPFTGSEGLSCFGKCLQICIYFFICYFAAPKPTLDHCWGGILTNVMFITAFNLFQPKCHQEPCNEVGSQGPAKHVVRFELGTFQFWM